MGIKHTFNHFNQTTGQIRNRNRNKKILRDECKWKTLFSFAWQWNIQWKDENLWDTVKTVLRGKFNAVNANLKKEETYQINALNVHLKELEKINKLNPKLVGRRNNKG